jgi:hypothetical protein
MCKTAAESCHFLRDPELPGSLYIRSGFRIWSYASACDCRFGRSVLTLKISFTLSDLSFLSAVPHSDSFVLCNELGHVLKNGSA